MKIIKRGSKDIPKEEAHGGSGARKLLATDQHVLSSHFEAFTHGYLPSGNSFDWHDHTDIEEIMYVLFGSGKVYDEDGEYDYGTGDVFVFPANIKHKITNTSDTENEMIFMRVGI